MRPTPRLSSAVELRVNPCLKPPAHASAPQSRVLRAAQHPHFEFCSPNYKMDVEFDPKQVPRKGAGMHPQAGRIPVGTEGGGQRAGVDGGSLDGGQVRVKPITLPRGVSLDG